MQGNNFNNLPLLQLDPPVTDSDIGEKQEILVQGSPMKCPGIPEDFVNAMLATAWPVM